MTVVLELKPDIEEALQKKASAKGSTIRDYVEDLVRKDIDLDELLAPVRKQFNDSGMTEEELDEFLNDIRKKVYQERQSTGKA